MERIEVVSSSVKTLGFADGVLEVEFHSTAEPRVYRYFPVDEIVADEFFAIGASIGFLVNKLKRQSGLTCERVDPAEVEYPGGFVFTTSDF